MRECRKKTVELRPEQRKWRPTSAIPSINKYTKQQNIILQVIDDGYEKHVESGGAHSHHCEHKNPFWMIDTKCVLPRSTQNICICCYHKILKSYTFTTFMHDII